MKLQVEKSWDLVLKEEFEKKYFKELMCFVSSEYSNKKESIFPKEENVFRAFKECNFQDLKVVIIGQDPYPTKGHANGLCFSVEENVKPFPKSLLNIFKEIESDLNQNIPLNGDLSRWAKQGVLLLNSVLTVEEGKAGSHSKKGWEKFSDEVIKEINERKEGVVFLLWGSKAQEKGMRIDNSRNLVLTSVHPSPLSSYRGFFGCKHFSKANDYLKLSGKSPIIW